MTDQQADPPIYDRQLLLGAKRSDVLELWEIERYGRDSYRDADYVSVYGMRPAEWYARGVRLLGRTAVECTRDELGDAIARDVAAIAVSASASPLIIDAFAGSANTLYWMQRRLSGADAIGFELDGRVFETTRSNLAHLAIPIGLANADYVDGLSRLSVAGHDLIIAFVAPPWGEARVDTRPQPSEANRPSQRARATLILRRLLFIPLDDRRRTHLGLVRILAELAPGVPLAQEIPALIERDFGFFEPHLIVICQPTFLVKMLLLMDETFDLPED